MPAPAPQPPAPVPAALAPGGGPGRHAGLRLGGRRRAPLLSPSSRLPPSCCRASLTRRSSPGEAGGSRAAPLAAGCSSSEHRAATAPIRSIDHRTRPRPDAAASPRQGPPPRRGSGAAGARGGAADIASAALLVIRHVPPSELLPRAPPRDPPEPAATIQLFPPRALRRPPALPTGQAGAEEGRRRRGSRPRGRRRRPPCPRPAPAPPLPAGPAPYPDALTRDPPPPRSPPQPPSRPLPRSRPRPAPGPGAAAAAPAPTLRGAGSATEGSRAGRPRPAPPFSTAPAVAPSAAAAATARKRTNGPPPSRPQQQQQQPQQAAATAAAGPVFAEGSLVLTRAKRGGARPAMVLPARDALRADTAARPSGAAGRHIATLSFEAPPKRGPGRSAWVPEAQLEAFDAEKAEAARQQAPLAAHAAFARALAYHTAPPAARGSPGRERALGRFREVTADLEDRLVDVAGRSEHCVVDPSDAFWGDWRGRKEAARSYEGMAASVSELLDALTPLSLTPAGARAKARGWLRPYLRPGGPPLTAAAIEKVLMEADRGETVDWTFIHTRKKARPR
eukprot:tig00000692_g3219.t1